MGERRPVRSIQAMTWPSRGEMRAMRLRVPDVGVDLVVDVLEFVEVGDGRALVGDGEVADFVEVFGVAEAEGGGAVGGDDVGGVVGHAPAFTGVGEGGELAEGGAVVDEADVGLPGPLVEVGAPVDDAFTEVLRGEVEVLE